MTNPQDISTLSSGAQSLLATLHQAAQVAAQSRGVGYAQIGEDYVGGLGQAAPERSKFADGEEGDAKFAAALDQWQPKEARDAVAELQSAGYDVAFSAGSRDRFIVLENYRLAVKR